MLWKSQFIMELHTFFAFTRSWFLRNNKLKQAWAELCQAQVKLEVIVEVWVVLGVEVEAFHCWARCSCCWSWSWSLVFFSDYGRTGRSDNNAISALGCSCSWSWSWAWQHTQGCTFYKLMAIFSPNLCVNRDILMVIFSLKNRDIFG